MSDHPVHGARILLERTGHPATEPAVCGDSGVTRYQAAILLPGARFDFTVDYGADGVPTITPIGTPAGDAPSVPAAAPPARATELLVSIARTVGRHAVAEDPPEWPRRVMRWRKVL